MRIVLAMLAVAGGTLIACGGSAKKTSTPTASVASSTASAATPVPTLATNTAAPPTATLTVATAVAPTLPPQATEAPPPSATEPPPPTPPSSGAVTLVAINILFDTSSLSALAGPVTVTFDNRDRAVAHNVHFFSKAGSIAMSDIKTGPSIETLSLGTLAPGAYAYKCDVHPTTMTGILIVS